MHNGNHSFKKLEGDAGRDPAEKKKEEKDDEKEEQR